MSHDLKDVDGTLEPEDQALLAELLPPLDERPGPARRRSAGASGAMVLAIVDAALAQRETPTVSMDEASLAPPTRLARWRGRPAALAAAALALFSLGAGAAVLVARVIRAPVAPPVPRVERAPVRAPAVVMPAVEEPATDVVEPEPEPAQPEPSVAVSPQASSKRHVVLHKRHRSTPKVVGAPVASGSNWLDEVDLASAPLEDLLALANRLRRGHEWRSADEVYQAVIDRFPGSDAAVVAEIASATLHVEQLKDASGALAGYRRALAARPTGALAEEARWGIVEALRALGDKQGEAAALREFLEHHPVSALVPAARRRAAELGN